MGVEYAHYLIPEDNTFKPSPDDLSRLVKALLDGGYVAGLGSGACNKLTFDSDGSEDHDGNAGCYIRLTSPDSASFPCPASAEDIAALGDRDFRLTWPVASSNESGLKYPLTPFPDWGDPYYDLELHLAKDFVYHSSEVIEPFKKVVCECGQPLEYNGINYWECQDADDSATVPVFFDVRIHRRCRSCGKQFRPQDLVAVVRDGHTGKPSDRAGGATYLFAVVIDCGKGFARQSWPIRATEEFLELVTITLGQRFYQIYDIY